MVVLSSHYMLVICGHGVAVFFGLSMVVLLVILALVYWFGQ